MKNNLSRAYEAPQALVLDLQAEESLLVAASLNGGTPPVPGAGDGGPIDDNFWN